MSFRITGLSPEPFLPLYGLPDDDLARHNAKRYVADAPVGYPDRIEMRDAAPGETLLLLNHTYQPADTPYRGSHAIFVREGATRTYDAVDEIPEVMRRRLLSLRSFDAADMMLDARVVAGQEVEGVINGFFADPAAAYIHVHTASRGCYLARVDRA